MYGMYVFLETVFNLLYLKMLSALHINGNRMLFSSYIVSIEHWWKTEIIWWLTEESII